MTRLHICCCLQRRNCAIMKLRLRIPESLILHYDRFHKRIVFLNASLTTERHQNIGIQTENVLRSLTNLSCWLFPHPQWCTFKPSFIVGCLETNTKHFNYNFSGEQLGWLQQPAGIWVSSNLFTLRCTLVKKVLGNFNMIEWKTSRSMLCEVVRVRITTEHRQLDTHCTAC